MRHVAGHEVGALDVLLQLQVLYQIIDVVAYNHFTLFGVEHDFMH